MNIPSRQIMIWQFPPVLVQRVPIHLREGSIGKKPTASIAVVWTTEGYLLVRACIAPEKIITVEMSWNVETNFI